MASTNHDRRGRAHRALRDFPPSDDFLPWPPAVADILNIPPPAAATPAAHHHHPEKHNTAHNHGAYSPIDVRDSHGLSVMLFPPAQVSAGSLPVTKYTPYHASWPADPLALPHNAIRRESIDLYRILYTLLSRSSPRISTTSTHRTEATQFLKWWTFFHDFLLRILDIEEDVVYARLDRARVEATTLAYPLRAKWKAGIVANLSVVGGGVRKGIAGTPGAGPRVDGLEGFVAVRGKVDAAIGELMAYCAEKEAVLVPMIEKQWTPYEAHESERDLVREMLRGGGGMADVQALTHWMREMCPGTYARWRQDCLPLLGSAALALGTVPFRKHLAIASLLTEEEVHKMGGGAGRGRDRIRRASGEVRRRSTSLSRRSGSLGRKGNFGSGSCKM